MGVFFEFVSLLGGFAVIVAALAWLIREIITHFLSKDVEKHKATLTKETAVAIERFRADLEQETIRFRRLDEKIAETLEGTYQRLHAFYEGVNRLVAILEWSGGPTKPELMERCEKANRDFNDFFYPRRCYVPPLLYKHIHKAAGDMVEVASQFKTEFQREEAGRPPFHEEDYWSKAFDTVRKEVTPLFSVIVEAVQKRLGVEDSDAEKSILAKADLPALKVEKDN